ncbi:MAG: TolC family protein, partial [Bacteroidia bacterium]
QSQLRTVTSYENTSLKRVEIITKAASQQFANGEINYLEWTMLINNAISIQSSYIDAIQELNKTIIQLNYLTSK